MCFRHFDQNKSFWYFVTILTFYQSLSYFLYFVLRIWILTICRSKIIRWFFLHFFIHCWVFAIRSWVFFIHVVIGSTYAFDILSETKIFPVWQLFNYYRTKSQIKYKKNFFGQSITILHIQLRTEFSIAYIIIYDIIIIIIIILHILYWYKPSSCKLLQVWTVKKTIERKVYLLKFRTPQCNLWKLSLFLVVFLFILTKK